MGIALCLGVLVQASTAVASSSRPDDILERPIAGATPTPVSPTVVPSRPAPLVIGRSVEGRPIEVYAFGNGPRTRMIIADIHGGYEWNTAALADQLIAFFTLYPSLVPPNVDAVHSA